MADENPTIIEQEGRLPYDASKRRLARGPYVQRNQDADYVSWQSKINIEPGGTINDEVLQDYLEDNYEEIRPKNIGKLGAGSRIAYVTKTNKWRSGGWFIRIEESTEDADGNQFDKPKIYALYKSFNNAVFSIQVEDVKMFYTRILKPKVIIKKMIYFKRPEQITNFPVFLVNREGDEVPVYFARDSAERKKITERTKYQQAAEDPDSWRFNDGEII